MEINTIRLSAQDSEIRVQANLSFQEAVRSFSFSVNSLLEIDSITGGNGDLDWRVARRWNPVFRSEVNEIVVEDRENLSSIIMSYHGKIDGWCNVVGQNCVALSFYSAWYPQETSVPVANFMIVLTGMQDYFVVNARYDPGRGEWTYGGQGYDTGNIIAFRKDAYFEPGEASFRFYCLAEEEMGSARLLTGHYRDVMDYYGKDLFEQKSISNINIVSLSLPEASGAYFRKELIVLSKLELDPKTGLANQNALAYLMAHELAHNWCMGADTGSWEDWLNETTAEWSSLLYALHRNDEELFNHIMEPKLSAYSEYPPIKTDDLSRPYGVHDKGTVLFHEIYKRYGKSVIEKMVRAFTLLKAKTTEHYINSLRDAVGEEVVSLVDRGLVMQTFENL